MHGGRALDASADVEGRKLAGAIVAFIKEMPISQALLRSVPRRKWRRIPDPSTSAPNGEAALAQA